MDKVVVCGMQAEASEKVLSASEETLRLGKSYSGGQSSEPCAERQEHTHGRR